MVEMATPSKVCFLLIYVFFEAILMSGIDRIRSCLEDYILLVLFDAYFHFAHSYVRVLSLWNFFIYSCIISNKYFSACISIYLYIIMFVYMYFYIFLYTFLYIYVVFIYFFLYLVYWYLCYLFYWYLWYIDVGDR